MNSPDSSPRRSPGISRRVFLGSAAGTGVLTLARPMRAISSTLPQAIQLRDDYVGRLCYNENPLGPSPAAMAAVIDGIALGHRYSDWFGDSLRGDLASLYGVSTSQVRAGCGGTEMLRLCACAMADPNGNVVCPTPSYGGFAGDCAIMGTTVRYAPLDPDHRIDLDAMAALIDGGTTAVCLTNPNNPTGTVLSAATIADFVDSIPGDVAVVIDEAYHDYVHDADYGSAVDLVRQGKNVIVIRTFSKAFGLAGVRIGYVVGHPALVGAMASWQTWGTVSRPALDASRAALGDTQHVANTVALADQTKAYCAGQFDLMSLECIPSEASFFMVDVGRSASQVAAQLAARGIMVRTGWGMPNHLRVSTGTMAEMQSFIEALQDILGATGTSGDQTAATTALYGNFPNPAQVETRIVYSVAQAERVRLEVFDIGGRRLSTVVDDQHSAGHYEFVWDLRDRLGRRVPAGLYYYRMTAGRRTETRRMIVL